MDRSKGDNRGRFAVEVELANNNDVALAHGGAIAPETIRRMTIRGVVDSGATRLVIPESIAQQLRLQLAGQVGVRYADGRIAQRTIASNVHLTWGGRSSVFNAIIEPERDSALIGAIVLGDLDLLVDCTTQTLRPRDPRFIISEVE